MRDYSRNARDNDGTMCGVRILIQKISFSSMQLGRLLPLSDTVAL
jgi:hypothetical protein